MSFSLLEDEGFSRYFECLCGEDEDYSVEILIQREGDELLGVGVNFYDEIGLQIYSGMFEAQDFELFNFNDIPEMLREIFEKNIDRFRIEKHENCLICSFEFIIHKKHINKSFTFEKLDDHLSKPIIQERYHQMIQLNQELEQEFIEKMNKIKLKSPPLAGMITRELQTNIPVTRF